MGAAVLRQQWINTSGAGDVFWEPTVRQPDPSLCYLIGSAL